MVERQKRDNDENTLYTLYRTNYLPLEMKDTGFHRLNEQIFEMNNAGIDCLHLYIEQTKIAIDIKKLLKTKN